ncbi:VacJ family lipoprotein [Orrella sp. JC864]|uniref:MlaA family lipoprotein n=1 Tax=Orrella sp. JC864 TaxID=3120298 RepID=UPI003008C36B
MKNLKRVAPLLAASALLAGCATSSQPDPRDPWEGANRGIYQFNDAVDRAVLRPVAEFYTFVTPQPARNCIHNVFSNLGEIWSATNSFLQARGHDFFNTLGRFLLNTTMGVGGCFDVASANGARKIPNDFGITLGVWGVGQGPYVVLPLLGPSTVRDGAGTAVGVFGNIVNVREIDNVRVRNSLWGLEVVDTRASLLEASKTVDRTAIDPYSFVRDAYLQRRNAQVLQRTGGADGADNLPDYSDDEDDVEPAAGQK